MRQLTSNCRENRWGQLVQGEARRGAKVVALSALSRPNNGPQDWDWDWDWGRLPVSCRSTMGSTAARQRFCAFSICHSYTITVAIFDSWLQDAKCGCKKCSERKSIYELTTLNIFKDHNHMQNPF